MMTSILFSLPRTAPRAGMFTILMLAFALGAAVTGNARAAGVALLTGGQPSAEDLAAFAANGGVHVIDLRDSGENRGFDEASVTKRFGIHYHNLPVSGPGGLTRDNALALDRLLAQTAGQHETTLLHCASGNRVGALMALRAKWLQGASTEEALAIGRSHGMTSLETQVKPLLQEK